MHPKIEVITAIMPKATTVIAKAGKVAEANPKRWSLNSMKRAIPKKSRKALIMAKLKAKIKVAFLTILAVPLLDAMVKLILLTMIAEKNPDKANSHAHCKISTLPANVIF